MPKYLSTLCALLLLAVPALAAETLDEKVYDPGRQAPASPATPGVSPDVRVVPGQTVPGPTPGDTIIVVPTVPGQTVPEQTVPGTLVPDTQKETPTLVVPAIPAVPANPVIPVVPVVPEAPKAPAPEKKDAEKKDAVIVPVQPQPVQPPAQEQKQDKTPPKAEDTLLTPADFLPTTPSKQEPPKAETKPKVEPPKDKAAPKLAPKAKPEDKTEQKPEQKSEQKKDKPAPEKKKGEALRIPPEAARSGNMDFLEGCWKGRLSGRRGRNEVTDNMGSRFCFDDKGKGKHFLYDPKNNETCVGSANGGLKADGTLRVDFDNLYCPSGETWYPQGDKYMTCRDGGNGAECKWYYKGQPKTTGPFYRD